VVTGLFGRYGIRAVGMQDVVNEAGTGKSLLYREFPSKEDLILAWLREGRSSWRDSFDEMVREHPGQPAGQLLAVVKSVHADMLTPEYRGSMFHNTVTEFPDPEHPAHQESRAHLQEVHERLENLAAQAEADDPAALADSLMLVIQGMHSSAATVGADGPARLGVTIAAALIRQHCPAASTEGSDLQ
jgi:AcrR family transcriptional regulator